MQPKWMNLITLHFFLIYFFAFDFINFSLKPYPRLRFFMYFRIIDCNMQMCYILVTVTTAFSAQTFAEGYSRLEMMS